MTLVSRVLPALYNGVSQQPPILRSSDQNDFEENTWASLADGVGKRPQTEHVARIANAVSDIAFIHHINRDVGERYIVIIDGGVIKVFDHETGTERVVHTPIGLDYVSGDSSNLRAITVADYTFIVNQSKVCGLAPVGTDIIAQGTSSVFLSNSSSSGVTGAVIAAVLAGRFVQYNPNPSGAVYRGEVASVDKLPTSGIGITTGSVYKVTGSVGNSINSYYVRRNGAVWDETVGISLQNAIDENTMPHCLIRNPDGSFTFATFSWAPRRVGDTSTNPPPTFIGRTIRDVFFYQNRLGLLVDENVVLSCAGEFGNYWRNTVLDYIDSDVISVGITTSSVSVLNHALPFNDGIFALSDQTQFSITNGEAGLTPSSIAIRPVTTYEVNQKVRPVTIGTEVYFCGDQNGASVVWEYTRLATTDATSAAEITAHVPQYIPAGISKLISAPNLKALFALTGTKDVYTYQFYWNGDQKILSAWRKWTFADPVLGGEYIDGFLYLMIRRADGVYLERVDLETSPIPRVLLDRIATISGVYNPVSGRTTYTLPYGADLSRLRIVRGWTHPTQAHALIDPSGYHLEGPLTVSVPGNEAAYPVAVGEAYTMTLRFSRQFPQNYRGQAVSTGRLQLRTFTVYYSDTAFFRTEVAPYGLATDPDIQTVVPAKLADFTGKVIGDDALRLNKPVYATGSYSFQIYGDSSQATVSLVNDTHVQSTFVSAEWEGFYFNRATG